MRGGGGGGLGGGGWGERKGLALLKDREGQITNNKTERQGGRGGGKKKREGKYVERRGRSERMEEGVVRVPGALHLSL